MMCARAGVDPYDGPEVLPHKVIGPCTYQYDPPKEPWDGFAALEVNGLAKPWYEVDKEKRILRVTRDCPDGGFPDETVDIVFHYYKPKSAQPEYYELTPDERLRKNFPRDRYP